MYRRSINHLPLDIRHSFLGVSQFVRFHYASRLQAPKALPNRITCSQRRLHTGDARELRPIKSDAASIQGFLDECKQSLQFPAATHEIKDLNDAKETLGQHITIHGYLGERTDLSKKFSFVPVISKDLRYSVQVISLANHQDQGQQDPSLHDRLKSVKANSAVAIDGIVKTRAPAKSSPPGTVMAPDVEIELRGLRCLNEFPKDIVFKDDTHFPPAQRHLQIRSDKGVREALAFRAKAASICRNELERQGFVEIETPTLFKSTPEGAREFLVPTRQKGLAYALPQSPQQYKQILMASGIPRYYQMARCFRDEDLRADRQPEFTQLDLEMSFATGEDVMRCIETLIRRLWKEALWVETLPSSFPRISYQEAMSRYGSDKPYTKLGMEISRIDHLVPVDLVSKITSLSAPVVEVIKVRVSEELRETRSFITTFMDSPEAKPFLENPDGQPGVFIVDQGKPLDGLQAFGFQAAEYLDDVLGLEHGDVLVVQARPDRPVSGGSTALGNLRLALHKAAVVQDIWRAPEGFEFLWVVDFPLFSAIDPVDPGQWGAAGLCSTHHPFTSPRSAADVDCLSTDPTQAKADHYDLVLNGVELGGGSRRIHDSRLQAFILKEVLKMPPDRFDEFSHLLEVLRAGCPPHAGIALGFDRLVAVMLGRDSIRDVIAFPKSGKGEDLLVRSPSLMSKAALETYHLDVVE